MPVPVDDLPRNLVSADDLPSNIVPESDLPNKRKTPRSMLESLEEGRKGLIEAGGSLASGAIAGPVSGLAGIAQGAKNLVSPGMSAADRVRQVQESLTYQPRTETGKGITEAASYPFQKLAEGADVVGKKTTDVTGSPVLGTAANVTLQSIPLMAGRIGRAGESPKSIAARDLTKAQNAQVDAGIQSAKDAGYVLPPSQANPSLLNRFLEGLGGKIKTAQTASIKNQPVTNDIARKALGLSEDAPLNADTLAAVRSGAGKPYESIKNLGTIKTDPLYEKTLSNVESLYEGAAKSFPKLQKSEVKQLVDGLRVKKFDAGSAIDQIKILRADADKAYRTGDKGLGKANKAAAQALDDMIDRHLQKLSVKDPAMKNLYQDYLSGRELIAKSYTVQKALKSDGNVDARVLGRELEKGKPLSGGLKTAGQVGSQFPKATQLPEKVGGVPLSIVDAAVGGGLAAALHNPVAALGVFGRPGVRAITTSKPYQKAFVNPQDYGPSGLVSLRDLAGRAQRIPGMSMAEIAAGQRQEQ